MANNPTEIALFEAMCLWPGRRINLVSLSTGSFQTPPDEENERCALSSRACIERSVGPMFDLVAAATNSAAIHSRVVAWLAAIAKHQPDKFNLVRLDPPCSAMDMATCDEKELDEIINAARSYLIQQPDRLDAALHLLRDH